MGLFEIPPKNMDLWLTNHIANIVNILNKLNGIPYMEGFRMLYYSDFYYLQIKPETGLWSYSEYWSYAELCRIYGIEIKPGQIGYPSPEQERLKALSAYVLIEAKETGMRTDFLYEKMRKTGIFEDYANGKIPKTKEAKDIVAKARRILKEVEKGETH